MASPVRDLRVVEHKRRPGASRVRRVQELRRGRPSALRHGVRATLLNRPDVDVEIALIFAARPGLDPIRDARLVEELAISLAARARCQLAMIAEGHTSTLTAYDSKLAPLIERLERQVHERERERRAAQRSGTADFSAYRDTRGARR